MQSSLRQLKRLLRLPALVFLLLSVVASPVLASVGDLHAGAEGGAMSQAASQAHLGLHTGGGENGDEASFLDTLLHASHCCGHPTAIASAFDFSPAFVPAARASATSTPVRASVRAVSPIRPPIAS